MNHKKSQGVTEYVVILVVAAIIALMVVAVMGGFNFDFRAKYSEKEFCEMNGYITSVEYEIFNKSFFCYGLKNDSVNTSKLYRYEDRLKPKKDKFEEKVVNDNCIEISNIKKIYVCEK